MRSRLTCREFVDFLADHLAGELEPRVRSAFDAHVERCPSCATYLNTYGRAMRLAKTTAAGEDEAVPTDVPEELIRAILAARSEAL